MSSVVRRILLLMLFCQLLIPATQASEPIVDQGDCYFMNGDQWAECVLHIAAGGSGGIEYYSLPLGVITSPECGHSDIGAITDVEPPTSGECSIWIGFGAGDATIPTPDVEQMASGSL